MIPAWRRRVIPMAAAAGLITLPAHAHLTNSGLGPFYDGVLHLLVSPMDLLPLLALSIFAGLRGTESGRAVLFALPLSWLAGGLAGLTARAEFTFPVAGTALIVAAGLLVASDARLPQSAVIALTVAAGLFSGVLNGSAMSSAGAGVRGISGIACAAFVVVALIAAFATTIRDGWQRIALRVAGSWIAAIGILMFGWTLRGSF